MTADSEMCIFCGRPWGAGVNHSEQHVLGKRLKKHAAGLPNARAKSSGSLLFDPDSRQFVAHPMTSPGARNSSLVNLATRDVCEECNTHWMRELEERATPLFLDLADAAANNAPLVISRTQARMLARRAQVMGLTHELTTPPDIRVGDSAMGMTLRRGGIARGSMVWLARTQVDLGIQIRQAQLSISPTPVVMPGDPENLSLMLAWSWFNFTVLVYIPEVPGRTQGPTLPFDRWTALQPCGGASGVEYPPMVPLHPSELDDAVTGRSWLPFVWNGGVRSA